MSDTLTSSRRTFLKNGAILAMPLAAAAAPAAVLADDELKARLAKLENEAAIRELHQSWLQRINNGDDVAGARDTVTLGFADAAWPGQVVRSIAAEHEGEPDAIEIAPDGKNAAGRFHCLVRIDTPLPKDCTLTQMAHAQGSGFVRRAERRVLQVRYVKADGAWSVAKAEFAQA